MHPTVASDSIQGLMSCQIFILVSDTSSVLDDFVSSKDCSLFVEIQN